MSIFNRNVKRERPLPTVINRKPQNSTSVPLLVGLYTPTIITENYDYVQLYYHGGGVYTAVTFVLDYKNGGSSPMLATMMVIMSPVGSCPLLKWFLKSFLRFTHSLWAWLSIFGFGFSGSGVMLTGFVKSTTAINLSNIVLSFL